MILVQFPSNMKDYTVTQSHGKHGYDAKRNGLTGPFYNSKSKEIDASVLDLVLGDESDKTFTTQCLSGKYSSLWRYDCGPQNWDTDGNCILCQFTYP